MNKIAHFIIHSKAAAYIAALLYIVVWCSRSVQVGGIGFSDCLGLLLSLVMGYLSVRVAREFSLNDIKNVLQKYKKGQVISVKGFVSQKSIEVPNANGDDPLHEYKNTYFITSFLSSEMQADFDDME